MGLVTVEFIRIKPGGRFDDLFEREILQKKLAGKDLGFVVERPTKLGKRVE